MVVVKLGGSIDELSYYRVQQRAFARSNIPNNADELSLLDGDSQLLQCEEGVESLDLRF